MKAYRRGNGEQEQCDDASGTALHVYPHRGRLRPDIGYREVHQGGRYHEVHHRRDEEVEEGPEGDDPLLLDHQGRDVAKGTECAPGIGSNHNVNTGQTDKARLLVADGQHHGAHNQRGGEVIGDR